MCCLQLEPNYHTSKWFSEKLLVIKMNKTEVKKKPVYLGLSVVGISKIAMCEYWYIYVALNYGDR